MKEKLKMKERRKEEDADKEFEQKGSKFVNV